MYEKTTGPAGPHILSRFDGDLGRFRQMVLDMGSRVLAQATMAAEATAQCDVGKARTVIHDRRIVRDLDMAALEANARLFAIHQPVARDLRFVLTLSRAVYDLERISGESVRLADITEGLYEYQPSVRECAIFEDVARISRPALALLERSLQALAGENLQLAVGVALDGRELEDLFKGALRRLATFLMEDPRNIRWVIEATLGVKTMERIGDHACSIARNIVFSLTGKDVRHASMVNLTGERPG